MLANKILFITLMVSFSYNAHSAIGEACLVTNTSGHFVEYGFKDDKGRCHSAPPNITSNSASREKIKAPAASVEEGELAEKKMRELREKNAHLKEENALLVEENERLTNENSLYAKEGKPSEKERKDSRITSTIIPSCKVRTKLPLKELEKKLSKKKANESLYILVSKGDTNAYNKLMLQLGDDREYLKNLTRCLDLDLISREMVANQRKIISLKERALIDLGKIYKEKGFWDAAYIDSNKAKLIQSLRVNLIRLRKRENISDKTYKLLFNRISDDVKAKAVKEEKDGKLYHILDVEKNTDALEKKEKILVFIKGKIRPIKNPFLKKIPRIDIDDEVDAGDPYSMREKSYPPYPVVSDNNKGKVVRGVEGNTWGEI